MRLAAVLALAIAALAATPAAAAERRATDEGENLEFRLDGTVLVVELLPEASEDVREQLVGRKVTASCGTSHIEGRATFAFRTKRWTRRRERVRFPLSRDMSRKVLWCLVEDREGGDIAVAEFRCRWSRKRCRQERRAAELPPELEDSR